MVAEEGSQEIRDFGEITWRRIWSLSRCPQCDRPTLEDYVWSDEVSDPESVRPKQLYPAPTDNRALPTAVQKQLTAALRVKALEPGLYAVAIRKMLEAVCHEEGAVGSTLSARISDLAERGRLPEVFGEMATHLRRLGNFGAHYSEAEVAADDVAIIEELADAVLEYLYRAPAKLASARQAIAKRFPS